jgi:hypothetical protein
MFISLLAVVINCYPVIFCGKSFVSPSDGVAMVYDRWPPLAGMEHTQPIWQHGSDVAATLLWAIPIGFVESRSILEHGDLPLWNRYGHGGDTLIGQAVSMLGDPLQFIVILGRGSAWAWDIKFLVAKYLFCVGFGLLILRLFGKGLLSLIYAALAAYSGAFFYINCHPAFFVFCYTPWVFLSALAFLDLRSGRCVAWGLIWLLVNFACFNAGHVEASVVVIGGLNLAALAYALALCRGIGDVGRVVGRMAAGTFLFLGLTAPVWLSFLGALEGAYSAHAKIAVTQFTPVMLPGLFDNVFYLFAKPPVALLEYAPGTSVLIGMACLVSALRWRQLKAEPIFWVNWSAIFLWGGCVYGWVPATVLKAIPLLNRVGHSYTDFSYLLVIHLTIQSAYGFKCLAQEKDIKRAAKDITWASLILALTITPYLIGVIHFNLPWNYLVAVLAAAAGAPLLFVYLMNRQRGISVWGWVGIVILGFIPNSRYGWYDFGTTILLQPGPRVTLDSPSQSVDQVKRDHSSPFRITGQGWDFFGDYSAVYGLEDIRSCAPLSSAEFIALVRNFPGIDFRNDWMLKVMDPVIAQPLLNLLNVKYVLYPGLAAPDERPDFRVVGRDDFCVVENLAAWPRAFFSDKVVSLSTTEEFTKYLQKNGNHPFVAMTPEEIQKCHGLSVLGTSGTVNIWSASNYQLLPNSTAFDIHASSAGIICLTEGQARDFTATANGQPEQVLTVNRAFKGIYLDRPGDYRVQFIYRPHHWQLALTLFWIAAGSVIALVLAVYLRPVFIKPHGDPVKN